MKSLLIILLLAFISLTAVANRDYRFNASPKSSEDSILSGVENVRLIYRFPTDIGFEDSIVFDLPNGWSVSYASAYANYEKGDTAVRMLAVNYPSDSLPYYATHILIRIFEKDSSNRLGGLLSTTEMVFYFTPYNTLEVWSIQDFNSLHRVWMSPNQAPPPRIFVPKDSIPTSNIPNNFEPSEPWQEDYQLTHIPGLAYAVPMMALNPDTAILGTIPVDSLGEDTSGTRHAGDGCWGFWNYKHKGNISGNVLDYFIVPDVPVGEHVAYLPLEGLEVQLWETGFFANKIGEMVTDEFGHFEMYLNHCSVEQTLELEVRIVSKNIQHDIKGKSGWTGGSPQIVLSTAANSWDGMIMPYIGDNDVNINFATTICQNEAHRAVHLAYRAWKYADENSGIQLDPPLVVRTDLSDGSFFLPDSYCGVSAVAATAALTAPLIAILAVVFPLAAVAVVALDVAAATYKPTIYLVHNIAVYENTPYHEFGHFLMWQLQDKCWTDIETGSFDPDHSIANDSGNIRIAWNEGWADFYSYVLDAHYRSWDNEWTWYGKAAYPFENRRVYPEISFGPSSEYNIACALYDLWDGPAKLVNTPAARYDDTNVLNDLDAWRNGEVDDVELSFSELADVIRNYDSYLGGNDVNVVSSVQSFYYLLQAGKNCEEAKNIKKVFDQNRVVGVIDNFPDNDYQGFSSDGLYAAEVGRVTGHSKTVTFDFLFDNSVLGDGATPEIYNVQPFYASNNRQLSDKLLIENIGSLYVNAVGTDHTVNDNGSPTNNLLYVTICNVITNNGLMYIGHDGNNPANRNIAEVEFVSSGGLILNAGSTLRVKPHSRIIFEPGSSFIYNGGSIILEGDDSYIDIQGHLTIGDYATFTFTGNGYIKLLSHENSGPSFTYGTNSRFILNGSGKNDLVLVTNEWMLETGNYLAELKITNGKVECDYNGGLNIGVKCTIDNVLITRRSDITGNNNYVHRGLSIYDQHETDASGQMFSTANVNDVEIEHGRNGFISIPWNVVPTVSNLYIHDCQDALHTIYAGI